MTSSSADSCRVGKAGDHVQKRNESLAGDELVFVNVVPLLPWILQNALLQVFSITSNI